MAADLPDDFDVIVLGTGLCESILAAAFSRIGLKVLHIDRNDYYSANWASFNLQGIEKWRSEQETAACYTSKLDGEGLSALLKTGEKAVELPKTFPTVFDAKSAFHIQERPQVVAKSTTANSEPRQTDASQSGPTSQTVVGASPESQSIESVSETPDNTVQEKTVQETAKTSVASTVPGQFDSASEDETESNALQEDASKREEKKGANADAGAEETPEEEKKKAREWFSDDVQKEWRRFSIDLAPKLLYCAGSVVELLIASDVAKYCEFRTVSRVLTIRDSKLEKVPCSRADVFASKVISLPEKRLLMKFLTFAAEYEQHPEEYKDFLDKSFVEFLTSRKLSPKIQHFVLHSIAMATSATSTEQGLANTQKFLRSLGRYGNTAFLFPLYGSGELPQAFCRLSAVFGGCYVLTLSASHIILDEENKCTAVVTSAGQRIACKYLIADPSYLPDHFYASSSDRRISRGVFITDGTIFPSPDEELSLLRVPEDNTIAPTSVLELPPSSMATPRNFNLVHMTRPAEKDAVSDLKHSVSVLFREEEESAGEEDYPKPRVLWSLYFQQRDLSTVSRTESVPSNVFVTAGPGIEFDMDRCVGEAQHIFKQICPDEEFLPKPPHPDDIIYVDDEETTAAGAGSDDWTQKSDSDGSGDAEADVKRNAESDANESKNSGESDTAEKVADREEKEKSEGKEKNEEEESAES